MIDWVQAGPVAATSFFASSVEAVEALTIVLAAGIVQGWRSALIGVAAALALLAVIVAAFGTAIAAVPIQYLQVVVGTLLVLFGIRWLRKAMLRYMPARSSCVMRPLISSNSGKRSAQAPRPRTPAGMP